MQQLYIVIRSWFWGLCNTYISKKFKTKKLDSGETLVRPYPARQPYSHLSRIAATVRALENNQRG